LVLSLDPPLEESAISHPESTTIRSADGLEIPLVVFPRTCGSPERPGPALIWLHYGPGADIAPRWYQEVQYLTALGMTVIAVNYRGSSGQGKKFKELMSDREGQMNDLLATIRYARGRPDVDPKAVVVFMVCWSTSFGYEALTRLADPVQAIIDWHGG